MYCGQQTLVNATFAEVSAKVLRCRSWQCEVCRPVRHRQMVAEATGGRPNRFITLTLRHEPQADPSEQGKRLSRAWRLICKRLQRLPGGTKVQYFARLEVTKRGTPHLHILARCGWIDQRQLSLYTAELLDAPIVWVEKIDQAKNVAAYVAKYLAKEDLKVGTCKRYWKSKGYDLRTPREKSAAAAAFDCHNITDAPIERVAKTYAGLGYAITWDGPDRFAGRCGIAPWHDAEDAPIGEDGHHGPPGPWPDEDAPFVRSPPPPTSERPLAVPF